MNDTRELQIADIKTEVCSCITPSVSESDNFILGNP